MGPSQGVLGNRGKRVFISGEQRSNFEGDRGTKTLFGNREHKITNFRFLGNKPIYFRGTGTPMGFVELGKRPNFERKMGTKTILGNRKHTKTNRN